MRQRVTSSRLRCEWQRLSVDGGGDGRGRKWGWQARGGEREDVEDWEDGGDAEDPDVYVTSMEG